MPYLLGIDLGTSGVKATLIDANGRTVAHSTEEYPLYQPQNGWAEQEPEDWWRATCLATQQTLQKSQISAAAITGIGLSGQMHGAVFLDRSGKALRKAIIWCDSRSKRQCDEITEKLGRERLLVIAANPALPGFTAGKILWVREHEPAVYAHCRHILLPKDYIRYRLTGEFATEASDASGTNLFDVSKRCWSQEILDALGISPSFLPRSFESTDITGQVSKSAAAQTGLAAGTPVVGGAGDNAASAVGTGVVQKGKALTTLGTSGVIFAPTDHLKIDHKGRVHSFCAAVPNTWTVMSCTLAAGLSLRWFRDQFCQEECASAQAAGLDPYTRMMEEAERSPIGANKLVFLPYLMGERSPILDTDARGAFVGLSGIHTKADMIRAVVEGITYSQRQCMEVFREMGVEIREIVACGGGAASPFWRQMLADVYNCPVKLVTSNEGAALGAAILAGVGVGVWPTVEDACSQVISDRDHLQPNIEASAAYEAFYHRYCDLYPALSQWFHDLAALSCGESDMP